MVEENQVTQQKPPATSDFPENVSGRNVGAEQELRARHIVSEMTQAGKIRDLRNRRQLAENLGRIISHRKNHLNLSELVVAASISENADPARLGRFRILPGKSVDQSVVKRLSQDPLAYVRLVKEIAKFTGDNQSMLIEELSLGTRFDPSGLEAVEIEPFEQLQTLIQKKIDAIDAKLDLDQYFHTIQKNGLLPVWSHGPVCGERVSSYHSVDKPQIVGWEKIPHSYRYIELRDQVMPCVPLCRIRSSRNESFPASIRSGKTLDEDATLNLYSRVFLGIGKFDREYVNAENFDPIIVKDPSPRPYLIFADEFHYSPGMEFMFSRPSDIPSTIAGGVVDQDGMPYIFYNENSDLEIRSLESPFWYEPSPGSDDPGYGMPVNCFESVYPLDLSLFRNVFGKSMDSEEDSFPASKVLTFKDKDSLDTHTLSMTLAPHNTIAEMIETNLLSPSTQDADGNLEINLTFLDKLEQDAECMTASLKEWMDSSTSDLEQRHKSLIEKFERECEDAKK